MGLIWEFEGGETPLDPDEYAGLRIPIISTRAELDEHEQVNIQRARVWLGKRKPNLIDLLTDAFVKQLHLQMYNEVWIWAGRFRKTEKNIGVDPIRIPTDLRQLLLDAHYWVENHTYPPDELVIRLKHRLVCIHCFSNGNGRHARLFADLMIKGLNGEPFSWGGFTEMPDVRDLYISSLREADRGNMQALVAFARS